DVAAEHAIVIAVAFAAGVEQSAGGRAEEIAPIAKNRREIFLFGEREPAALARRDEKVRAAVLGDDRADGVLAGLAGQLHAPFRIGDVAAVDRVEARFEDVGAFEKERP